eukprot:1161127-Pelagomonas_calceolata.AAC.9
MKQLSLCPCSQEVDFVMNNHGANILLNWKRLWRMKRCVVQLLSLLLSLLLVGAFTEGFSLEPLAQHPETPWRVHNWSEGALVLTWDQSMRGTSFAGGWVIHMTCRAMP